MKRILLGLGALGLVGAAAAWSGPQPRPAGLAFRPEARNPVTHLRLNNAAADFQFAVVSDRTGGHRAQAFARAVEQLNLLQPEFVVCVGDLIEGYTDDRERLAAQWREFQGYVAKLQMPFFYVPGNHDLANATQEAVWKEKFGRRYYHFVYRGVLFLCLNSDDPPGTKAGHVSAEQAAYVRNALAANPGVRWTLVFLHQPLWSYADADKTGWPAVEQALGDRPYTVFCGHVHRYQKFVRRGRSYYQLATTGGASKMRGVPYGEFDHVVWVTMKQSGPVLANVLLDGVLPEDLRTPDSDEKGVSTAQRRPTHPVRGRVHFEGAPAAGAYVVLQEVVQQGQQPARADGLVDADGSFTLSTYTAHDGAPAGAYAATVVWRKPFVDAAGRPGPNLLPARYARPETTPLKVAVKEGPNELTLEVSK